MNDTVDPLHRAMNPLLERARFPGETFALPSGGLLYDNGELDDNVTRGEVLVYPMVTLDEVTMKTPDKLLNGTAITEVFRRCIPQVKKPLGLFAKDVDFLMVCLRKISYGDEIEITEKHDCKDAEEHGYLVNINKPFSKAKRLSKKAISSYSVTLPNGQVVNMIPPRYYKILEFYQSMNQSMENMGERATDTIIQTLLSIISSVDNINNKEHIHDWLRQLPAGYVNKISEKIPLITNWGIDLEVELECKDCKNKFKTTIGLNPIDFFS